MSAPHEQKHVPPLAVASAPAAAGMTLVRAEKWAQYPLPAMKNAGLRDDKVSRGVN